MAYAGLEVRLLSEEELLWSGKRLSVEEVGSRVLVCERWESSLGRVPVFIFLPQVRRRKERMAGVLQGDCKSSGVIFEAATSQRSTNRSCLGFSLSTLRSRFPTAYRKLESAVVVFHVMFITWLLKPQMEKDPDLSSDIPLLEPEPNSIGSLPPLYYSYALTVH
jgi:hypothetical protein